ncbi:MAG: cytochrome c3 family protein [Bacteriovoracaceae bacterium]|nr:cytochrome c3 family protein [Bacteriovoracaceae bacterium]
MKRMKLGFILVTLFIIDVALAHGQIKHLKMDNEMIKKGKKCIECHATKHPGIVSDWKNSRHAHAGVTCLDCHKQPKNSKMGKKHPDVDVTVEEYISVMVTPKTCEKCHPQKVKEFNASGHFRGRKQYIKKDGLNKLITYHEGQNHPKFSKSPGVTGCIQCHGSIIKMDENKNPTADTWPNSGIASIWPDGSIGNCRACHTRHKFDIAEARKPVACAHCHIGPDHPDIEIFNNSKHGQLFNAEGSKWKFDDPAGAWEPGSYRGPVCATCHMSGIGDLTPTHNVSKRLKWNLWGKSSKLRNSSDPMSPLTGNAKKGRAEMEKVCFNCHSTGHTKKFFTQADNAIMLYNEAYYAPAEKMRKELAAKNLLKKNPWEDKFLKIYYHLWHHEGRRARQAAAMGSPDYAHWHGFFELMQDLYQLKQIYAKRLKTGKI